MWSVIQSCMVQVKFFFNNTYHANKIIAFFPPLYPNPNLVFLHIKKKKNKYIIIENVKKVVFFLLQKQHIYVGWWEKRKRKSKKKRSTQRKIIVVNIGQGWRARTLWCCVCFVCLEMLLHLNRKIFISSMSKYALSSFPSPFLFVWKY